MMEEEIGDKRWMDVKDVVSEEVWGRVQKNLIEEFPDSRKKLESIELSSQKIIHRPKQLINLFQANEYTHSQKDKIVLAWMSLLELLNQLLTQMPLNTCLIYENCKFGIKNTNKPVDFVSYIIFKINQFIDLQCIPQNKAQLIQHLTKFYEHFLLNCSVPLSSFYLITRLLCQRLYNNKLSIQAIETSYSLLQSIGRGQKRTENRFSEKSAKPFFYFDGKARIGVRVLMTNNKWVFSKGLHLCLWFNSFKSQEIGTKEIILVNLKTDDKKSIKIIKQREELAVQCLAGNEKSYRKVCDLPSNTPIKLQIILKNREAGLFKSNQYDLTVGVNGSYCRNIEIKVPKFHSNSFITDFNLLQNYFGLLYSAVIASSQISLPSALLSESDLSNFCQNNQEGESIITILSPLRVHQGIVINEFNSEKNHACHEAAYLLQQIIPINQIFHRPQISLPLIYLCSCLFVNQKKFSISPEQRKKLTKIFNKIVCEFCQKLFDKEIDEHCNNYFSCNRHLANLFLFYFLEHTEYPINQVTLNTIVDKCCLDSYSGIYMIKYLDFYGVLKSKLLNIEKALVNYNKRKIQEIDKKLAKGKQQIESKVMEQQINGEIETCNPVTKVQLLFLLQTQWKKYWNKLQYSSDWWNPPFSFQNNLPFQDSCYLYRPVHDQDGNQILQNKQFQWSVSDFITNDFCDCLLVPQIKTPPYADFNKFHEMFLNKECMSEGFEEPDIWRCFLDSGKGSKGRKYQFKQISKSVLGKLKQKIYQTSQNISSTTNLIFSHESSMPMQLKLDSDSYFEAPVCYLNLLTLYIGVITVRITSSGQKGMKNIYEEPLRLNSPNNAVIAFYPTHTSKELDHLCVKAYKYEQYQAIYMNSKDIKSIRKRRYNQSMNGLQIRLKSGNNYLFYFHDRSQKYLDKFISKLCPAILPVSIVSKDPYQDYLKSNYTIQWIDKQISNYEYLQYLNDVSGRSYTDITQYPVLPWIFISNQEQAELNLQHNYRDLSKNMGSLGGEERKHHFMQKFQTKNETQMFGDYHFGTHYSSSAIIFNFLIRLQPFSTGAITLQSGKFDCADRVFSSYIGSWVNATTSTTDIRELVPELFILPQMLINVNNYDFGYTQLKQRICNVELPQWSSKNPYKFCSVLRKALEHQKTCEKIKHWIDLIYGYKQQGKAAVESMNIYFPLTYELAINLDKISDAEQKISIETQIAHFGQNPAQIIGSSPHPDRLEKLKWQNKLIADGNKLQIQRTNLAKVHAVLEEKFIYQSVFEDKNSILSIKFITQNLFLVLRRYQFIVFKILDEQSGFISKEREVDYVTEKDNISLDYLSIQNVVPMVVIDESMAIVGGFYDGNLQIIFLKEIKYSGNLKLPMKTISALSYEQNYQFLYVGDSIGNLGVYELGFSSKDVTLIQKFYDRVHANKINSISTNYKANLFVTASSDGVVKLFNLYSQQTYRKICNPFGCSVIFAAISTCPLYSIVFYSEEDSKLYSYSINGQFLGEKEEPTGFIYNMKIQRASDNSEYAITLNANREINIEELPFLKAKKKIRLKKDNYRISCFEVTDRIAIAGSQDGGLQIIADPSSF